MRTASQLAVAVGHRVLRRADVVIFRCTGPIQKPPELGELQLLRMGGAHNIDLGKVESTMQRAGELGVDATARFEKGHEFFALQGPDGIVAFRWVNFAEDHAGHTHLKGGPHRAFLYNGFTLREYRGRGLTNVLMLHMRSLLAADGRTDLVCGINTRNTSSLRARRKGGFDEVALVRELVLLNHFHLPLRPLVHTANARELMGISA